MITLKCDKCDKPIQVPDDQAGRKVQCPHCGDVNLVPMRAGVVGASAGGGPRDTRAEAAGYPAADGPEKTVLKLHASVFRAHPFQFIIGMVLIVGAIVTAILTSFLVVPSIIAGVVALAAIGYLGWRKIEKLSASLEITNKRVIERKGIISRFVSEIRHSDIRNVQVQQSIFDRIMGVGHIGISTAGQEGFEIELKDIPNPERLRKVLDLYRPL